MVIRLGAAGEPAKVWAVYGMKDRDVIRAFRLVERHREEIQRAWEEIHG